jgi:hypothetical protein
MHARRLACLLLGFWLAGGLSIAWLALDRPASVERALLRPNPAVRLAIREIGPARARQLLEYQAAEQVRTGMETWHTAGVLFGVFFFLFLLFATGERKFSLLLALLMLATAVAQRVLVTPEQVSLGRSLDFVSSPPAAELSHLGAMRVVYASLELGNWALGALLAVRLILRRHHCSADAGIELDGVDKRDHRHVDR